MQDPQSVDTFNATAGGLGYYAQHGFHAETIDAELSRCVTLCGCQQMQVSLGFRYAELDRFSSLQVNQLVSNDFYSGAAFSQIKFAGPGITASATGQIPWGCSDGFHLFYTLRASMLWDDHTTNIAETSAEYRSLLTSAKSYDGAAASSAAELFISEAQIGGEWNYALKCIPATVVFRAAFEYQYWAATNTGTAKTFSFAGPLSGTPMGLATARSGNAFVDLIGFNVGAGLTW